MRDFASDGKTGTITSTNPAVCGFEWIRLSRVPNRPFLIARKAIDFDSIVDRMTVEMTGRIRRKTDRENSSDSKIVKRSLPGISEKSK
jgi:hypothetical protein